MSLNLLSFVWKRQASSHSMVPSISSSDSSSSQVPPLVTASTSETYGDDDAAAVIVVPAIHAPSTPEGLKPRQSFQQIRRRLSLPEEFLTGARKASHPLSTSTNNRPNTLETAVHDSQQLAPSRRISSSWSLQGTISSPPISTSSFYASWSADDVATSPNLVPGRARTAVGALVAQQQYKQQAVALDYSKPFNAKTDQPLARSKAMSMSILPPPTFYPLDTPTFDLQQDDDHFRAPYVPPPSQSNVLPTRYQRNMQQPFMPYQPLNSPPRNNVSKRAHSPTQDSAMVASPSSLAAAKQQQQGRSQQHQPPLAESAAILDTSFSSRAKLLDPHNSSDMYDIAPIIDAPPTGTEVVLRHHHGDYLLAFKNSIEDDTDPRDLSAMSYSAAANMEHDDIVWSRTISVDDGSVDASREHNDNGKTEMNAKERRQLEDLFSHVLERLQDDVELVAQVEAIGESASYGNWFTKTCLDKDGLVTGFAKDSRASIVRKLNDMLQKVDAEHLPTENKAHVDSPESFDMFRDSLLFCRQLVYMSMAEKATKMYQLKEGIRPALGIIPPESPEMVRRGGDSSVFSLPPDDHTPMTSNVSLSTTITTHHSPPRYVSTLGLQLRRTIETVLALLQVLTRAFLRLDGEEWDTDRDGTLVVDEIKCAYQQIIELDCQDLCSLMDAFEPCRSIDRGVFPYRNLQQPPDSQQPILPRAPVMTPPRRGVSWNASDDIEEEEEEGFEMQLDYRDPFNEARFAANDGVRDDSLAVHGSRAQADPLNFLAGICTRISEAT
ncbi:hypothetical protein MPSEU_000933700 [Mayamaea pseudoterrestris]|nr:hypothetical protein MPSEU_000933700 [Mayamaea pseudoterrestris]